MGSLGITRVELMLFTRLMKFQIHLVKGSDKLLLAWGLQTSESCIRMSIAQANTGCPSTLK